MYSAGQGANFYGYSGISDSLAGIFEALADQEGMHGKRYRHADVWALLTDVAERRFATGIYELCHLLRGFGRIDRRGEAVNIFWQADPATPNGFKSLLTSHSNSPRLSDQISIKDNMLWLSYSDGKEFQVKSGRMPYLAALFDFLVNAIGFIDLQAELKKLNQEDLTHRGLSDISNALFSMCYAFLGDYLPTSQGQRKMRHILTFLNAYHGEGFHLSDIKDETILAFWEDQEFGPDNELGSDFVRFSTVFDDYTRFSQSVRETLSKRDVIHAKVIGTDFEAGEVTPEDIGADDRGYGTEADEVLARLSEPPLDEIKFLGKKDTDILSDVMDRCEEVCHWARSYLRARTFGQGQARISQALRNKVDVKQFQALCEESSKTDFADQTIQAEKLHDGLKITYLASLYVVQTLAAKQENADKVELDFKILAKARKAFHSINRQGFQEDVFDHPERADLFEQGADCLEVVENRYERILTAIQKVDPAAYGLEDKSRFAQQFHKIYGGHG